MRECQREMADEIESAIDSKSNLIAESGTGTGKTFGYLVPPLAANKKTVVSTRTKNLQEQLFKTDIPWVCDALNIDPDVRMLKGRSNYFCLYRHNLANRQDDFFGKVEKLNRVYDWVKTERPDGDISEYPSLPVEFRPMITSTSENCLGSSCEYSSECYVNRARIAAHSADVLVVNHNLLCLGVIGSDDESNWLSSKDVVIVDEAHRLPEIAAQTLGISVSTDRLHRFCENLQTAVKESAAGEVWIERSINAILELSEQAKESISDSDANLSLAKVEDKPQFMQYYKEICAVLLELSDKLDPFVSPAFDKCKFDAAQIQEDAVQIFARQSMDNASWCEKTNKGFKVSRIPLEPGRDFGAKLREFDGSWIFTSATLAVGEDFTYFKERMGIPETTACRWESPFEFEKQALVYYPPNLPEPTDDRFNYAVANLVKELMPITRGRTFVLFTSYHAMYAVHDMVKRELDYKLLCQGKGSNSNLLKQFRDDGNAVLFGTSSFWEGVDVRGEALSCVIIAKLPFAPFQDPVMDARRVYMQETGQNMFNEWQVPTAVLTMKQGSGRLIRDDTDKGMLVMCDRRINTKSYGEKFRNSLPPMRSTQDIDVVKRFFRNDSSWH